MAPQAQRTSAVALLQEFVQCSRTAAAPQHCSILQWSYEQAMSGPTSLRFRATVAFLLDGVPHHAAGGWQATKKNAQRDTAERALRLFVGKCGQQLLDEPPQVEVAAQACSEVYALERYCLSTRGFDGALPVWTHHCNGFQCTAQVEVKLLGVPHKFMGAAKPSKEAACTDTARRVLWYLQCPGYEQAFSADAAAPSGSAAKITPPPEHWACTGEEEVEELRETERRTALMRVQNRLQQELARSVKPGQGVWEWSFESHSEDATWPPLRRATVHVPGLAMRFVGGWARNQQQAQVEASLLVEEYLNRGREASLPSTSSGSFEGSDDGAERGWRWADAEIEQM